jgi:hypothetical protein
MNSELSSVIMRLKSSYLDPRQIGIRRFSAMTQIPRTRLNDIFSGTASATVGEVVKMDNAIQLIEIRHQKVQDRKNKPLKVEYVPE